MDQSTPAVSNMALPCYNARQYCILPHQENYSRPFCSTHPPPPLSSYGTDKKDSATQQGYDTEKQGSSKSGVKRVMNCIDSAYSSEHENTPEQQDATLSLSKGISVTLLDEDLWKSFHKIGNEMIVTKPGRRLFPALLVSIRGLQPYMDYTITLRVASADPYRYKFLNMQWSMVGESEVNQNESKQTYHHPSSPNSGAFWMKKPISFKAVKITHNPNSKHGNILLHTMHKYVIEIIVNPADGSGDVVSTLKETTFVAVSAYQNTNLTQLKIDNNPFAKGFRDRLRAAALHPHMHTFASGIPSLPFYSGEGYRSTTLIGQSAGQTLNTSAAVTSLPNTETSSANLPVLPSLPSFAHSFPSHLTPLYPSHNYSFFTPTHMGITIPTLHESPATTQQ